VLLVFPFPRFVGRFSEAYKREIETFIFSIWRDEKPTSNEDDDLRVCILSEAAKTSVRKGNHRSFFHVQHITCIPKVSKHSVCIIKSWLCSYKQLLT
jgi:hypothetical protein